MKQARDGVMDGKFAHHYDKHIFKEGITNTFLERNVKPGSKIADLCCGSGISIEFLKNKAIEIVGVDAAKEMVKLSRIRFSGDKRIKIIEAYAHNTGLKSNYFDYVLVRMSFHHIKNKAAVFDEIYRILKPNGYLIVMDRFKRFNWIITYAYDFFRELIKRHPLMGHHYVFISDFYKTTDGKFMKKYERKSAKEVYYKANIIMQKT